MIKLTELLFFLFICLFSQYGLADSDLGSGWKTIPVKSTLTIKGNDGKPLTIEPACAFDNLINPADGSTIDNSFHFYFKPGKKDKLVVFFNGGGACWDGATCLTSLVKGTRPTYNPSIYNRNSPIGAGGLFDDDNAENPFKEWSKVFIPYCSGDIHVGSKTVTYIDDGSLTGYSGAPVTVKHHGFDNFLAVREWIKGKFSTENILEKLLVTGSSAGGYGATLNFPYLQDAFPKTNAVLLSDAATAVVTQGFLNTVFYPGGNWNLENTLHKIYVKDFNNHYSVDSFNATLIEKLTTIYPKGRFAQYTTEDDVVQMQFLKIMTRIYSYFIDPVGWGFTGATEEDQNIWFSWNNQMEDSLADIDHHTVNYQYYMGQGTVHTILTDAFATASILHPFYDEHSADNVWFSDWIDRFVNSTKFNKESLKYIQ